MKPVVKRSANEEQQKAIYHNGGKLLSAGAGSGKTFVLIEHIIFLLEQIKINTSGSDWNKSISLKLSSIVLMTFTKKAAGEMSVRMMKRVDEILDSKSTEEDVLNYSYWTLVRQNLSLLNITTIHSFCHRLLRLGFWNDFPQEINLVSSIEHKDKIQKLFDKWFMANRITLDPVFLACSDSLLVSMREIFSSPELRVLWKNLKSISSANIEIDKLWSQLVDVMGYRSLFLNSIDLNTTEKEKSKKWFELLIDFNKVVSKCGLVNYLNYESYNDFFNTIIRFPTTNSKEISIEQRETLDDIKNFKNDMKELFDDLKSLDDNFNIYKKWVETISEVFNFIDSHYFEVDGFSFSDLEYYVLEGLNKPEVLMKVQESFSYFIVDEFQDTSFIQFEILKKLIGKDFEKLFCVGDKKQAIYGFRGGELQVFANCSQMLGLENNYFLKNNFRSLSSIINFNNELFENVFPLGLKYEGKDPHSVNMEAQTIPFSSTVDQGKIVSLRVEVVGQNAEFDLDQLESRILVEHIKTLLLNDSFKSICVLYRKLKPSGLLLEHLLLGDVSFGAQVKIQFGDDPLINILIYLIELRLNQNNLIKRESTFLLLETLLNILEVNFFSRTLTAQFEIDLSLMGLRLAFHKFIFAIGLSNSFYFQNAELIDAICRLTKEDIAKVYHLLKNDEDENYNSEMMSGESSLDGLKRIIIMSAHASKGLEFDAVLLGGIHTNGRYNGMRNHIGKMPHSFKWKKRFDQKKFFKSPFYHLESEILTLKDFSESKRLLYVACTRAVKHLAFVDLWSMVKEVPTDLYNNNNSWIQALRLNQTDRIESSLINSTEQKIDISFIQRDSLGLLARNNQFSFGLISELSVTRLSTLADCPFKFYLQNICKIESDKKLPSLRLIEEDDDDEVEVFYSSKKRGTEIHAYLSKLYLKEINISDLPLKEKDKILWAYNISKKFPSSFEVISERHIKFSFFGQIISGTPDIVFVDQDSEEIKDIVIWDFKTGIQNLEGEDSYWFQVLSYAYAYSNLLSLNPDRKMELSLLYLDQENIVTKQLSLNEITQILFSYWKKTESLDQVNSAHCPHCEYSLICQKGKNITL